MNKTDASPLLRTENLTKVFQQGKTDITAVNDLNLEINRGEVFGLVGESGCGKSTLGHMLVHLLRPTAGKIFFDGEDITAPQKARLKELCRMIQLVFQDPYASIDTGKTIGWLLEEPLKIHKLCSRTERKETVMDMLNAVGLDESFYRRFPTELSGGQRQRVAIALALILKPEFVICDEPVSALDVSVQAQVLNLLLELREKFKLTYLFISHDLNVVSYISDRIGVMYLGNLVELGSAVAVSENPLHPYTRALFSATADPDSESERIVLSGDPPSPADPPTGCAFHTRCPYCTARCKTEKPAFRSFGDGRFCACHHAKALTETIHE